MFQMQATRRKTIKGIGAGTAVLVGGVNPVGAADGDAKLRAAHAVPDAPAVDVLVNGNVAVADLAFGDVTGYLEVPAGEYDVAINVAGTSTTVFSATIELAAEDYTAAAIGNLEPEGDEPGFTVDIFTDKLGVLDSGDGRVRAYHASPDAPAVDVAVADANDEPAIYLAQDLSFGSAGPNVEVAAGTYPVAVYPAGSSTPVFGPVDVTIREGEVLTAFAEGELEPEGDEAGFQPVPAYEEAAPLRPRERSIAIRDRFGGPPSNRPSYLNGSPRHTIVPINHPPPYSGVTIGVVQRRWSIRPVYLQSVPSLNPGNGGGALAGAGRHAGGTQPGPSAAGARGAPPQCQPTGRGPRLGLQNRQTPPRGAGGERRDREYGQRLRRGLLADRPGPTQLGDRPGDYSAGRTMNTTRQLTRRSSGGKPR